MRRTLPSLLYVLDAVRRIDLSGSSTTRRPAGPSITSPSGCAAYELDIGLGNLGWFTSRGEQDHLERVARQTRRMAEAPLRR